MPLLSLLLHQGLIDVQARRSLSRLAIGVFTPALMVSKLGLHIDAGQALALWPIGANVILAHLTGLFLGWVHTRLLPTPERLVNIIRVSTAISNTGNLPLVMVMSFVKNPNLPFNTAAEAELAVSYVMLGWFYATMVQMPLGHWLLHKDSQPTAAPLAASSSSSSEAATMTVTIAAVAAEINMACPQPTTAAAAAAAAPLALATAAHTAASVSTVPLLSSGRPPFAAAATAESHLPVAREAASSLSSVGITAVLPPSQATGTPQSLQQQRQQLEQLWQSLQHHPSPQHEQQLHALNPLLPSNTNSVGGSGQSAAVAAGENSGSNSSGDSAISLCRRLVGAGVLSAQQLAQLQQWLVEYAPLLKGVVSAPHMAGFAAIAIGSCPPLRDALFLPGGKLSIAGDVLDMMGQPLIPLLLLVLGANLAAGPGPEHLPLHSVLAVVATRLVLLPLLGCGVVLGAQGSGLIDVQDPLALVVMMVAWSTPTAILVHSLASVHRHGEDEVSALLFWEYLSCIVSLPLCSATYLYLIGSCMSYAA
uniref:Auxin efflux carrier n=1 Tax=Tetradesmus obliquus TaxID=3088 RepID=A0A383VRR9_TETOB|eukprot:jgi/Sobl393_1/14547/SZX68217.1